MLHLIVDKLHQVHVTMHQIIVDGVSVFRIFPLELIKLYEAFAEGRPSPLPEPGIQYGDFARWQKEFLGQEILERQLNYWQEQLSGELPSLEWPCDRARLSILAYRGSIVSGEWPSVVAEQLHEIRGDASDSLSMVLVADFVLLLYKST